MSRAPGIEMLQHKGVHSAVYKVAPWSHMSPYTIEFVYQQKWWGPLGITDHWLPKDRIGMSSSGAKIYCEGPPEGLSEAFTFVCSLLLETDFDAPDQREPEDPEQFITRVEACFPPQRIDEPYGSFSFVPEGAIDHHGTLGMSGGV